MTNNEAVKYIIHRGHKAWVKDGFVWGVRDVTIKDDGGTIQRFGQLRFLGKNPPIEKIIECLEN